MSTQVINPTQANDNNLFFSRKVIKPVKGGGKSTIPASNPYASSSGAQRHSNSMNFQDFMTMKNQT